MGPYIICFNAEVPKIHTKSLFYTLLGPFFIKKEQSCLKQTIESKRKHDGRTGIRSREASPDTMRKALVACDLPAAIAAAQYVAATRDDQPLQLVSTPFMALGINTILHLYVPNVISCSQTICGVLRL